MSAGAPFNDGKQVTPNPDFDVEAYCAKLAAADTEHAHQRALFGWLNHMVLTQEHPMARLCFAVPNGGKRDPITAARLKAEGVKAGVPDVVYPVPRASWCGLFMELKAGNGRTSDDQDEWHTLLRQCGHAVAVCWGWQMARQCFRDYDAGRPVAMKYKT